MGRKQVFHKLRIDSIGYQIALWELTGRDEYAYGLRLFFGSLVDEASIEAQKAEFAQHNAELAANYVPKKIEKKPTRKTGTYREVRTVKNRKGGKSYRWEYDVTYVDGKRVKSKSIGRVGE